MANALEITSLVSIIKINLEELGYPADVVEKYKIEFCQDEDNPYDNDKVFDEDGKLVSDSWHFAGYELGDIENSWLYKHLKSLIFIKDEIIKEICELIDKTVLFSECHREMDTL